MILLSRILAHSDTQTACAVDIGPDALFMDRGGRVPAWVGVEYLAQCVAAHAGLCARARGEPVKVGLLIGARRLELHAPGFAVGQTLTAQATHVWGAHESASFQCRLLDAATEVVLVEGHLSVFQPESLERFLGERLRS
jgi:predicted hotdog family 3-hydroxylacyl-ACP dehydratase